MPLNDALLPEFEQEMANTRKLLERVPEARAAWRPHDKSRSLGELAVHLAGIVGWMASTMSQDSFDLAPPGGRRDPPPTWVSRADTLRLFDQNVGLARAALLKNDDAAYQRPWSLKRGGQTLMTIPRATVVRRFLFSHSIHHRGQLTVYLRLLGVPLPPLYGPTADESGM